MRPSLATPRLLLDIDAIIHAYQPMAGCESA